MAIQSKCSLCWSLHIHMVFELLRMLPRHMVPSIGGSRLEALGISAGLASTTVKTFGPMARYQFVKPTAKNLQDTQVCCMTTANDFRSRTLRPWRQTCAND